MTERRALVVGASGQVGRAVSEALAARGWTVVGTGNSRAVGGLIHLDLLDQASFGHVVEQVRPTLCVISAGMTYVDGCEASPERAHAVNAVAPTLLAQACQGIGAKTIYLSTEYVFDGLRGPYSEDDRPRPISVYGVSKLAGERGVLAADPGNLSVRTTVVYGWRPDDKNFVMQLLQRLGAGERMRVPADQVSSPTYAPDLGEAIATLANEVRGVLNVVGPDVVDRYEFARRACRHLGLDDRLLEPVTTAELRQTAARPLRAGLTIERLLAHGIRMRGVDEGLIAFAAAMRASTGASPA